MKGYVYLISDGSNYKIGMTKNHPDKRLKQLQTGSAYKLNIVGSGYYDNAKNAERSFHNQFRSKRIGGEWFNLTGSDIGQILESFKPVDELDMPLEGGWLMVFGLLTMFSGSVFAFSIDMFNIHIADAVFVGVIVSTLGLGIVLYLIGYVQNETAKNKQRGK